MISILKEKSLLFLIFFAIIEIVLPCSGKSSEKRQKTKDCFNIIITVDTEGWRGKRPFDTMILGRVKGDEREVGVPLIMDLCDKHGVKATFFLEVFQYRIHGEQRMADLARRILARGYDVQLHTHPAYDFSNSSSNSFDEQTFLYCVHSPRKIHMQEYSFEEQKTMLQEGIDKLVEWTGERPVAHRAGAYSANYDTLAALAAVGISIDASMFWNYPECNLNDPLLTRNKVVAYPTENGIIFELPVTVFQHQEEFSIRPIKHKLKHINISKVDIDWLSLEQLKGVINLLYELGVNPVTIFLHSFTFVDPVSNWDTVDSDKIQADTEDIVEFDELLEWIVSHPDWKILTVKEISNILDNNPSAMIHSDDVPILAESVGYIDVWDRALHAKTTKSIVFIAVHILGLCAVLVLGIRFMKKRKGNIG